MKYILLANKIREILSEGLNLSRDVLHYIDSTFSNPSVRELEDIMAHGSDSETDSLIELIFFPDEVFQIRLEYLLEKEIFQKADEETVSEYLFSDGPLETTLHFPDGRGVLRLFMPRWAAESFVSRLNISKQTDRRLIQGIHTYPPEEYRDILKVRFRNTRAALTEKRIVFMCQLFEKTADQPGDILDQTDFILSFFEQLPKDRDIYPALMDEKRLCFRNLQKAAKFEEQLKKNNIETLILQGVRGPCISTDETLKRIAMIDAVSVIVFGGTDYANHQASDLNLGEYHGIRDIERVIQMLS